MADAYIIDAVRSPMGRAGKGALATVRPDDLAAGVVDALLSRNAWLPRPRIDDVIAATAMPEAEQGMNLGRIVSQRAGLPDSVPGMTLNRFCASGLEAVATACARVHAGMADIVVTVGVESMSRIPMGGHHFSPNPTLARERPDNYLGMGLTAENLADLFHIAREQQDLFALRSHQRAVAAEDAGHWRAERVPVRLAAGAGAVAPAAGGPGAAAVAAGAGGTSAGGTSAGGTGAGWPAAADAVLERDELPRRETSLEALAALKPSFREGGSITAGNSSPLTDGAAALLVVSDAVVRQHDLRPLGRLVSYAVVGVEPGLMGIGPVPATRKALQRCGWRVADLDHVELNEAFAAQALAVLRELELDPGRTNPLGGAIALGHPLGCSGARLAGTLLHAMRRTGGWRGLVTLCVGGGMGAAAVFEAL